MGSLLNDNMCLLQKLENIKPIIGETNAIVIYTRTVGGAGEPTVAECGADANSEEEREATHIRSGVFIKVHKSATFPHNDASQSVTMENFRSFKTFSKRKNQIQSILGGERRGELARTLRLFETKQHKKAMRRQSMSIFYISFYTDNELDTC